MLHNVLLIDDSDPDLIYGEVVLKAAGCDHVTPVGTAAEALALLASPEGAEIELILLDINMPEMDGFGFLARYEAELARRHPCAVVVMLTSSPDPKDKARARSFACVKGYIVKPIDVESVHALEVLLQGRPDSAAW